MLLLRTCMGYHIRKPRVLCDNYRSFLNYKASLRQARHQVHVEAMDYQNMIEDKYLQQHQEDMRRRHFDNQCTFRGQVFMQSFRLSEDQKKWKQRDDIFSGRQNKFLHEEDVRKINRSRILKIMEHESTNYWFNSENVEGRLRQETLFPEYIASSEYYYKLFAEALAYEMGDFEEVHQMSSNEEIIKEKNKYLIPLYLQLRGKIAAYKRDEVNVETLKNKIAVEKIQSSGLSEAEREERIQKQNQKFQAKLKVIEDRDHSVEGRSRLFRQKVVDLISILTTWKEYTNVLSLTSAQIIRNQQDLKNESSINKVEREVLASLDTGKDNDFLSSVEEDTEELEISFEEYLEKINEKKKDTEAFGESTTMQELEGLLQASEGTPRGEDSISLDLNSESPLDLGNLLRESSEEMMKQATTKESGVVMPQVNSEFLNAKETTSSVQILKEYFKEDAEFILILNQLGELDVRYPRLFETIWANIEE